MARHSVAGLVFRLFATGCGFLFAVAAARMLGPRGYGAIAVSLSVATVMSTLALLGTNGLAVRETASLAARRTWSQLRAFIKWSSFTVLFTSLVLGALMAVASLVAGPYRDTLLLASISVPYLAGLLLLRGISQGAGQTVAAQVPLDVIRWVVTLLLIGALLVQGTAVSPPIIFVIILISFAVSLFAAIAILQRYLARIPDADAAPADSHRWLPDSFPFLSIALFGIVGTEINTLLLGMLAGPREAGLYQPIARLAPIMMLAREAIEMPLAPRIVGMLQEGSREDLERLLRRSALASLIVTSGIAVMILAFAPYIFAAFGSEFEEYQGYLWWIAAAQVANAAVGASPLLLMMGGSMKHRVRAQAVTLAVQAGLGLALVPIWGAAGAVLSLTAAIITWSVLHWILAWRETGIDTSAVGALRLLGGPRG